MENLHEIDYSKLFKFRSLFQDFVCQLERFQNILMVTRDLRPFLFYYIPKQWNWNKMWQVFLSHWATKFMWVHLSLVMSSLMKLSFFLILTYFILHEFSIILMKVFILDIFDSFLRILKDFYCRILIFRAYF